MRSSQRLSKPWIPCGSKWRAALGCAGVMLLAPSANALPTAPGVICQQHPDSRACVQQRVDCLLCHSTPPQHNAYGQALEAALKTLDGYTKEAFDQYLPDALSQVAQVDTDGDGEDNLTELLQGTQPGDAASNSGMMGMPDAVWDAGVALRRVSVKFCGLSPSYEQNQALATTPDPRAFVHAALSECLGSDYWRDQGLQRMADKRIRPLFETGLLGSVSLADYGWDYRLFSYILREDRDARELLLADYHIDESWNVVEGAIPRQRAFEVGTRISLGTGQPLAPERRAGMITTQWFLANNTMFSELPRTSAAQAYRAYLGLDIAEGQGLQPIAGEPRDVDERGVAQAECAVCHSTLDPLAYAFSTYNGIEAGNPLDLAFGNPLGYYAPNRQPWGGDSYLFGEPVEDLLEWASKAANSDAFRINLARMFFEHAMDRPAFEEEADDFAGLWQEIPADGYSANKLIQRIVDLPSFGGVK